MQFNFKYGMPSISKNENKYDIYLLNMNLPPLTIPTGNNTNGISCMVVIQYITVENCKEIDVIITLMYPVNMR